LMALNITGDLVRTSLRRRLRSRRRSRSARLEETFKCEDYQ
jgi:hypothetical protein